MKKTLKKRKFKKNEKIASSLALVCYIATIILLFVESNTNAKENVNVGEVSTIRIKAPEKMLNKIKTDELIEEAIENTEVYYKLDNDITEEIYEDFDKFWTDVLKERTIYKRYMSNFTDPSQSIKEKYYIRNESILNVIKKEELVELLDMEDNEYKKYKTFTEESLKKVVEDGIDADNLVKTFAMAENLIRRSPYANMISMKTYKILTSFLRANKIVDEEATQMAIDISIGKVEDVYYLKGQTIVDEGEIITEEMEYVLRQSGYADKNLSEYIINYISVILTTTIFFAFTIYSAIKNDKKIAKETNKILASSVIYIIFLIAMFFANSPITILAPIFILTYLFTRYIGVKLTTMFLLHIILITYLVFDITSEMLIFLIVSCNILILYVKQINEKNKIIIGGILISLLLASFYILLGVSNGENFKMLLNESYKLIGTLLLSIIFAYGVSPIFETIFDLVTTNRLMEFIKPDFELTRRLTVEAGGTYHHSLIVSNLAEEGALAIGANSAVCKVAGYFHDIGKLKYPLYFGENQNGYNPHDYLLPSKSAHYIKAHIDGVDEIAKKYKLPKIIREVIKQHHGDTHISYFYYKALGDDKLKDSVVESDYRYDSLKPQSKEAGILMIADTVEAAVRATINKMESFDEVESFIDKLVDGKIKDEQLLYSGLTFGDVDKIKKSFLVVLKGMYHNRVEYPSEKETEENES